MDAGCSLSRNLDSSRGQLEEPDSVRPSRSSASVDITFRSLTVFFDSIGQEQKSAVGNGRSTLLSLSDDAGTTRIIAGFSDLGSFRSDHQEPEQNRGQYAGEASDQHRRQTLSRISSTKTTGSRRRYRGECGIKNSSVTILSVSKPITIAPLPRRSCDPVHYITPADGVRYLGWPLRMAKPFRWQPSSGAPQSQPRHGVGKVS
jgi:hypothetical protein